MEKKILRATAKKFKKALRGEISLVNAVDYAKNIGYNVVFFQSPDNKYLKRYDLSEAAESIPAFTYNEMAHIIFINDHLSHHDKLHKLLHELGHISLGHIGGNTLYLLNKDEIEAEAETFVYIVLYNKKQTNRFQLILAILLILLSLAGLIIGYSIRSDKSDNKTYIEETDASDIVYVTPTGRKYHSADCIYTKDKDCTTLKRAEAEKLYSPCKVCNP